MRKFLFTLTLIAASTTASSHEYLEFDELMAAFGADLESVEITSQEVSDGVYVLFGSGGNILASVGDQGTLIVDSMYAQLVPKIQNELRNLGGNGVDFTLNTHFHFDHADGNPLLSSDGAWIVTQSNARRMMAGEHPIDLVDFAYLQPAYPRESLPVITFDDHMQFHFNNENIDLMHFGPAHTTGDAAIYFRNANIIHMGDVFNAGYPFIDAGNGGGLDGMIKFCKSVLNTIEEDTAVLPGHGPILGYEDLSLYIDMLETVRDRIVYMIDAGSSLEEVIAAEPTREFDDRYGDPGRLIDRAYMSLAR
ncbi:MAG: MBL fold metallo-hydrolase [SAR86 cluster bacterium]|uniref:MBL fold metallo-hydrolase n=1 Tax=SAR86 cluster bacterium TaxID=2030880 RepID=A0A2A5C8F5_9GAMM|nr:MAG: MBL fold metallo-hydrolase [SAR86 cluster bacterium]